MYWLQPWKKKMVHMPPATQKPIMTSCPSLNDKVGNAYILLGKEVVPSDSKKATPTIVAPRAATRKMAWVMGRRMVGQF